MPGEDDCNDWGVLVMLIGEHDQRPWSVAEIIPNVWFWLVEQAISAMSQPDEAPIANLNSLRQKVFDRRSRHATAKIILHGFMNGYHLEWPDRAFQDSHNGLRDNASPELAIDWR